MKKTAFIYFSLAAIAAGSFTACQEADLGFDEETIREAALAREFTKNFEDRYGKIDPEHNWGFENVVVPAFTRTTEVNRNEWYTIQNTYQVQFPGWPFEDQGTGDKYSNKFNALNLDGSNPVYVANPTYDESSSVPKYLNGSTEIMPAGDVTDEEIQYVSWWFRTHKDPGKEPLHLTDFFIQEVSSDYDRNTDGTIRTTTASMGDNLTYNMDYIEASKTEAVSANADHTSNFNHQHSNWLGGNTSMYMGSTAITNNPDLHYSQRLCEFFTSSGTEGFQCKSSDDHSVNNDWNLVHLVFDIAGHHYDGYYLGFDYSFSKDVEVGKSVLERDHYYSNWIVKISPAKPLPQYTRRIMCEDLGNTLDFDFNDVVFDVTYSDGSDVLITVQASGGTLPIYIGEYDAAHEAHYLLGRPSHKIPVNVNSPLVPAADKRLYEGVVANFRYTPSSKNPDDIPIYVDQTGKSSAENIIKLQPAKGVKGTDIAPQKFCVPVGVRWMKENQQIEDSYSQFRTWVQKMSDAPTWFLNANITDTGKLYASGNGLTTTDFEYDHSHNGETPSSNSQPISFANPTKDTNFFAAGGLKAGVTYDFEVIIPSDCYYVAFSMDNNNAFSYNNGTVDGGINPVFNASTRIWTFSATVNASFKIADGGGAITSIKAKPKNN